MPPIRIMMIRHAEKPVVDKKHPDNDRKGVTYHGESDDKCLIPRGWARAGALVRLFAPGASSGPMTPATIYSASRDDGGSHRPYETVHPLATMLSLTVNEYAKDDGQTMMTAAQEQTGIVLIAWQHELIPTLVSYLSDPPTVPQKWPDDRFDLVWVFDPLDNGGWKFWQFPQMLLAGDSSKPIT